MPTKRKVKIVYRNNNDNSKDVDDELLNLPPYFEKEGLENEADLLSIATSIFILEQYVEKDVLEINIPISPYSNINHKKLKEIIEKIILFLIDMDINVNLIVEDYNRTKDYSYEELSKYDYIVPFSGGMDSFAGVLISKEKFNDIVAITAGHRNQGPIQSLLYEIYNHILSKHKISWRYVSVESHPLGIAQTRGFLYLILAGLFAKRYEAKNIIVTECGLTMHQPKFTNADIITKTTDPYLMDLTKELLAIYKINVEFIIPFSNLTKAEIAAISPEEEFIKNTNSCLNTMWAKHPNFTHCGFCYGCILRRISNIVAGIEDANYASFVLTEEPGHPYLAKRGSTVSKESYDNLVNMLSFAYKILEGKDNLLFYTKERIKRYNKKDLFRRFALDIFAAIYLLKRGKVNSLLDRTYEEALSHGLITEEMLKKRIQDVREKRYRPDFSIRI